MKAYLTLLFPAAKVTFIAVPIAMVLDQLGRGDTLLRTLTFLPFWLPYVFLYGLPFLLVGSGLALLLQRLLGEWGRRGAGRVTFILACAGLGAALVLLTSLAPISAVAGGLAAWSASAPEPPPRGYVPVLAGLVIGLALGLLLY